MMVRAMRAVDLVANSELAVCSRASEAGGLAFVTVLGLLVATWMTGDGGAAEFATRSTARRARTIMARKLGIGVLLAVTLRLYFRNSVRTSAGHLVQHVPMKAPQARRTPVRTFDRNNRKFTSGRLRSSHQICQARCAAITSIPIA